MQVSKWGNSLALRLPAEIVQILRLKEGDQVEIKVLGDREFGIGPDKHRERALEDLRKLGWQLPASYKFDREEINER